MDTKTKHVAPFPSSLRLKDLLRNQCVLVVSVVGMVTSGVKVDGVSFVDSAMSTVFARTGCC